MKILLIPALIAPLALGLAGPATAQSSAPHTAQHAAPAAATAQPLARTTLVFDRALPNVPGKSLRAVLVEYGPGGSSPAHLHAPSAFIYATVLEGAVRSQLNGGPVQVFRAGESFTEMPGDHHGVSANASTTERARLLAVFVVNTDETVLTQPLAN